MTKSKKYQVLGSIALFFFIFVRFEQLPYVLEDFSDIQYPLKKNAEKFGQRHKHDFVNGWSRTT